MEDIAEASCVLGELLLDVQPVARERTLLVLRGSGCSAGRASGRVGGSGSALWLGARWRAGDSGSSCGGDIGAQIGEMGARIGEAAHLRCAGAPLARRPAIILASCPYGAKKMVAQEMTDWLSAPPPPTPPSKKLKV